MTSLHRESTDSLIYIGTHASSHENVSLIPRLFTVNVGVCMSTFSSATVDKSILQCSTNGKCVMDPVHVLVQVTWTDSLPPFLGLPV